MPKPKKPSRHDLANAAARIKVVTDWIANREGASPPTPETVKAATGVLADPMVRWRNGDCVMVHHAKVHHVGGHLVALYYDDAECRDSLIYGECSCGSETVCEHLLVALAPVTATGKVGSNPV